MAAFASPGGPLGISSASRIRGAPGKLTRADDSLAGKVFGFLLTYPF